MYSTATQEENGTQHAVGGSGARWGPVRKPHRRPAVASDSQLDRSSPCRKVRHHSQGKDGRDSRDQAGSGDRGKGWGGRERGQT